MNSNKHLIRVVLIVSTAIILITLSFILWAYFSPSSFLEPKSKDTLITESAKTLLQLAGIAVLGGFVKLLYDEITEQRHKEEKAKDHEQAIQTVAMEMRKELLNDLINARTAVEAARIKYQVEESLNPVEQYRIAVLAIVEARLKLSHIWNAIETSKYLFVDSHEITSNVELMKKYLNELIGEYENSIEEIRIFPADKVVSALRSSKVFGDFISKQEEKEDSEYERSFLRDAYRPAVSKIRKEVLVGSKLTAQNLA